MATLGQAYVQIVPSAKGIAGSIDGVLSGEAKKAGDSAGQSIASRIKSAIVAAGIGTAITAGIKKSLLEGSELEQNIGGTKAVFGDFYSDIQTKAKDAYMNMGMSASDYMATANKMGSLFRGSGIDQKKSLDMTTEAMQRAADVASVMGIDTQWAMDSIANAAKGNFTMMDNLGVAMNATTLEAYALEKGINFKWNTASNAEKAELAMKMFMDRTSDYAGNFAKESADTFSGSLGAMKAAYDNLMGNMMLGENIGPAMENLAKTASTFLFKNLIPAIGNVIKSVPVAVGTFMKTGFPVFIQQGSQLIKGLTQGVKNNFPVMIQSFMTSFMGLSGKLRKGFSKFVDMGLELIKSLANGVIKSIPTFIETVPTIISNFAGLINDNAPKLITTGIGILKNLVVGIIKAIPVLIANIPKITKAFVDVFNAFQWANLGKFAVKGIAKGVKALVSSVKTAAGNIKNAIVDKIKEAPGKVLEAVNKIKSHLSFSGLKTAVADLFAAVKEKIMTPINAAKDKISGYVDTIKSKLGFSGLKSDVGGVFNGIKDKIISPIKSAKNTVSDIVDKIKGFFKNMKLKIPKPQVPKISLKWDSKEVFGKTFKYPTGFSVHYAKGGIMDRATMFGMMGNARLIGGEAGPEAILPLDPFWAQMDRIEQVSGIDYDLLAKVLVGALAEVTLENNINLDGKTMGRSMTPLVNRQLYMQGALDGRHA